MSPIRDGGCGHGRVTCAACRRSRQAFTDFLATDPTDNEKREWLMAYSAAMREASEWPRNGC